MPDPYASTPTTISSQGEDAAVIVPHDTNEIALTPKAIYVGTGGHIVCRGIGGSADVTFFNVPSGTFLPFRPSFIRATGTTASNLLGIY